MDLLRFRLAWQVDWLSAKFKKYERSWITHYELNSFYDPEEVL
jgi:hypothetical protein